jgi:hypothetical protein
VRVTGVCVCVCQKAEFFNILPGGMLERFVFFHSSAAEDGEKKGPAKNNKQEKMSRWELERKIGNRKTKQQTEGEC